MPNAKKIPEHQAIYGQIRDAILFGELIPGQAVTIQGLAELTGAGMTPVREAIRRLTAEGALAALDNRRIVVPRLTVPEIEQLSIARQAIEPKLAELGTVSADHHLLADLRKIDGQLDQAIASGDVKAYLLLNHRFHFRLYEQSGATILCQLAHSLWLRSGPSSRVVCGRLGTQNLPDMHDDMMDAIARNDPARAGAAMSADIAQGMGQIRDAAQRAQQDRRVDAQTLVK